MSGEHHFTLYQEPQEVTLDSVGEGGFTTFFGMGIVNPMGPTLSVLAAEGIEKVGARFRLLHLMLNPFNQTCHVVGIVELGEKWSPLTDLRPFFSLPFGGCPTLLIPSALYSNECSQSLFTQLLLNFDGGIQALAGLRQYPGNPWKRIDAEIAGATGLLSRLRKGILGEVQLRRLTPKEASEFARMQLLPANLKSELDAFLYAWKGSIKFTKQQHVAMSQETFLNMFGRLALLARMPGMSNLIDNPDLLR